MHARSTSRRTRPPAHPVLFVVLLAAATLFGGFLGTYSIAFYRAIRPTPA